MPTLPPTAEAYPQNSPDESPFFAAARLAAEGFILPEGWQEGRNRLGGLAVDGINSLDKDDVVGFTGIEGEGTLRVSISDAGTFLLPITPVRVVAEKRKWSKYDIDGRPTRPMIEPAISEDKMSLLHQAERPVSTAHIPVGDPGVTGKTTLSYDVMMATSLTYEQADYLLANEDSISPTALTLRGLHQVAINLRNARLHDGSRIGRYTKAQNDEGEFIDGAGITQFIIQEAMIAANAGVLTYMLENNIPAMFRNNLPTGMKFAEAMANIDMLETLGASRALWEAESLGHVMLRKPVYGHWTSPLRRLADFINHANLAAHHADKEYPYPQKFIETLAERMNFLKGRERAPTRARQFIPERLVVTNAVELSEAIEQGEPTPLQLATALFGVRGSAEEIAATKRSAGEYLTFNATQSNAVMQVAASRNYLAIRAPRPDEDAAGARFVAELSDGSIYPYTPGPKQRVFDANTRLLGAVAGLTTEEAAPKAANIKIPAEYMEWLKRERYVGYRCIVDRAGPGQFTATGILRIGDKKYMETLPASSLNSARNLMAELFMDRFNLAIELPEKLPEKPEPKPAKITPPPQASKSKLQPAQQLIQHQQIIGGEKPVYTYLGFDTEQGGHVWKVEIVDGNGVPQEEIGGSRDKQKAKQAAANRLLGQLPKLPGKKARRREREALAATNDEATTETNNES
jgi:hypothetical protein